MVIPQAFISIGVIVTAVIVVIAIFTQNTPIERSIQHVAPSISPEFTSSPTQGTASCQVRLKNIANDNARVNYCKTDSDCRVLDNSVCPFDCYVLYNKQENIDAIAQTMKEFEQQCGTPCVRDCGIPPQLHELVCQQGECVDTRFETDF